jgi:hypothetical protein
MKHKQILAVNHSRGETVQSNLNNKSANMNPHHSSGQKCWYATAGQLSTTTSTNLKRALALCFITDYIFQLQSGFRGCLTVEAVHIQPEESLELELDSCSEFSW